MKRSLAALLLGAALLVPLAGAAQRIEMEDAHLVFDYPDSWLVVSPQLAMVYERLLADGGIDASLCAGLGGEKYKILFMTDEKHGYGREFDVKNTELSVFVKNAKTVFGTKRAVVYGSGRTKISKAASFCGGGAEYCAKYVKNGGAADLIISSDLPHHVIKLIVESGKCVLILPHYAAENYGFRQFYEKAAADLKGFAETMFFTDKRFK